MTGNDEEREMVQEEMGRSWRQEPNVSREGLGWLRESREMKTELGVGRKKARIPYEECSNWLSVSRALVW